MHFLWSAMGIGWISTALTWAKGCIDCAKKQVELRRELFAARNQEAKNEQLIQRLQDSAKLRPVLVLSFSAYWEWDNATSKYKPHPYCTRCFDVSGLAVHLQEKPLDGNERQNWACPECKESIPVGSWFRPPDKGPNGEEPT